MADTLSLKIEKRLWQDKFPSYNRPEVIGYFSLDSDRNYRADLSQLKYVNNRDFECLSTDGATCRVNYDLDKGRQNAIKKDDAVNEKLENLLKWMLDDRRQKENVPPDIVCYRGVLAMLMCTPYEKQEGWILCGTKFQGTLYLCQFETEEKKRRREQMTDRDRQFMSWGYKFEQYMSSDSLQGKPDTTIPVNEREELCVVFMTKLNCRRLMFGAEMDGVMNRSGVKSLNELRDAKFVELKTSRKVDTDRQYNNLKRFKFVKWWSQSFLVGIEYLICGFRNDRGIVQFLERFDVKRLPKKAKDAWNPNVCMNFCDKFLEFANFAVQEEDPQTVWKFTWQPHEEVNVIKVPGPSEYSFLPAWFTENCSSPQKKPVR